MRILYQLTSPMEKTVLGADEVVRRRDFLRQRAGLGVEVEVRSLGDGPASIESAWESKPMYAGVDSPIIRGRPIAFAWSRISCSRCR